jgi:hypothetical protein
MAKLRKILSASARAGALLTLAGLGGLLSGCARPSDGLPPILFTPSGEPVSFKRLEVHPQLDYFHHIRRAAYRAPENGFEAASEDQESIVDQWGPPSHVRKPFKTMEDEKVEEWLYYDRQQIFQFSGGALIYDGPMTDMETLLLRRGYPHRATTAISETGKVKHVFVYRRLTDSYRVEAYNLTNGWIVSAVQLH